MTFVRGQIIPIEKLNELDIIIQNIKLDYTNQTYINNLITAWEGLPISSNETNIQDNIERILELQNAYIGK